VNRNGRRPRDGVIAFMYRPDRVGPEPEPRPAERLWLGPPRWALAKRHAIERLGPWWRFRRPPDLNRAKPGRRRPLTVRRWRHR
jgi:hypothetical protein